MPTLESLQSVIQLGVAINGAIFSVAALREPLVAREREATDALARQHALMLDHRTVKEDPNWREFHAQCLKIKADFRECEKWIERWDKWIQLIAFVAAALSFIALVVSAYCSKEIVGHSWVLVLVGLTILPSVAAIVFNARYVSKKLDAITRGRRKADDQLIDLYNKIKKE